MCDYNPVQATKCAITCCCSFDNFDNCLGSDLRVSNVAVYVNSEDLKIGLFRVVDD